MTLQDIQKVLDTKVDYANRTAMENKMTDCLNATGPCAKLQAKAKGTLEKKKGEVMKKYPNEGYRILKMRIDHETAQEQEDYLLAERLGISLFKTIDGLKSLLAIQEQDEQELKWQ